MATQTRTVTANNVITYVITDNLGNTLTLVVTNTIGSGIGMTFASVGNLRRDAQLRLVTLLGKLINGGAPTVI